MSLLCDNCGEPLIKEGDHFVCRHCGSIYEENHDTLLEGLASILGEAKMEKLAASRRLLYEASHAKYPSKQKVVESARRVLEIHPDGLLFSPFNLDNTWRTNGHFRRHLDKGLAVVNQQVFPDAFAITVALTNANSR
jgi:hypothetical protein